jgi:diguanylate cyclase (GGDEF)-like protein
MIEMCLLTASMGFKVFDLRAERGAVRKAHVHYLETFSKQLTQQVAEKTQALEDARANAELEAGTDSLTNLFNRRAFNEMVPTAIKSAVRSSLTAPIILIDIDHFKLVNDNHGHETGDRVLAAVADTLSQSMRENDILARVGGEEFAIFSSSNSQIGMYSFCERIREAVEKLSVEIEPGKPINLTISLGVDSTEQPLELRIMLQRADAVLYLSKQGGRNQTTQSQVTQTT